MKVGSREKIRIHSRIGEGKRNALVTFEGEGIISHRILRLKENWNDVEFAVAHEHFPNFYMAVAVMEGQKIRTAGKEFTVERELAVSIKPVKEAYLPGEEAKVEIRATDGLGKPVKAELSLALVDEALFAIYPDNLEPITDFFQKGTHRDAAMRTTSSCTFRYQPATQQVIKEVLEEVERLARQADMEDRRAGEAEKLRQLAAGRAMAAKSELTEPELAGQWAVNGPVSRDDLSLGELSGNLSDEYGFEYKKLQEQGALGSSTEHYAGFAAGNSLARGEPAEQIQIRQEFSQL